jgi:hypothetical protein
MSTVSGVIRCKSRHGKPFEEGIKMVLGEDMGVVHEKSWNTPSWFSSGSKRNIGIPNICAIDSKLSCGK